MSLILQYNERTKDMKIQSKLHIILAAALMCLGAASCKKDTTIMYENLTMGNVTDGIFTSDQGNIFNVVEYEGNLYEELLKTERAYTLCDILRKTVGGQDNEYDVRLNAMARVLAKDIVTLEDEKTEEILKEDPIDIKYCWFSGGYLNLYIEFPVKAGSETSHKINLIQQETLEDYRFRLTHNAYGETRENNPGVTFITGGGYVSFPINKVIKENNAEILLEWTWYTPCGEETEVTGTYLTYKKGSFEHPTKEATSKTMAIIE